MLENYKIPNTEEAKSLLDELGYDVTGLNDRASFLYAKAQDKNVFNGVVHPEDYESISVEKLRDLVVLKRNDVKDATHTHKNFKQARSIILSATNEVCDWVEGKWKITCRQVSELMPISIQDPALISGAEALRALADGKEVEFQTSGKVGFWRNISETKFEYREILEEKSHASTVTFRFRLKPQNIKLELELPKPFKPRDGDDCFIVDSEQEDGFYRFTYSEDSGFHQNFIQFGVYKTEDDVKKAVEQLRKIRGV